MRGFTPHPDSRTFLGKSPRDPKKPDCIGFRLSNVDNEQGCRTAALLFARREPSAPQPPRCHACLPSLPRPPFPPRPHARRARTRSSPRRDSETADFGFLQSISNFVVSLPNVREKDVKGLLFRKQPRNGRRLSAFRNWESTSNFVASLPNLSKKDVKGLFSAVVRFHLSKLGKHFKL